MANFQFSGTLAICSSRHRTLLGALLALAAFCAFAALGSGSAPAQTGFLACVKLKNPGKGLLRLSNTGRCRGNERGILINQSGPRGPAGTPGGPQDHRESRDRWACREPLELRVPQVPRVPPGPPVLRV